VTTYGRIGVIPEDEREFFLLVETQTLISRRIHISYFPHPLLILLGTWESR
jgi:hypothetical protein